MDSRGSDRVESRVVANTAMHLRLHKTPLISWAADCSLLSDCSIPHFASDVRRISSAFGSSL